MHNYNEQLRIIRELCHRLDQLEANIDSISQEKTNASLIGEYETAKEKVIKHLILILSSQNTMDADTIDQ